MKKVMLVCSVVLVLFACNKKEPEAAGEAMRAAAKMIAPECAKEIITAQPVKVGETGIVLPIGTKLCFSQDNLEIRVELPGGYNFWSNKALPIYATYTCNCSVSGSACQVFYAEGLGFGCLQSSCSGSCTGKFTYKGYTVEKVIAAKSEFFELPEVQAEIKNITPTGDYSEHEVFGVSFFLVSNEEKFMAAAICDCEGTQACKLKKVKIPFIATIYFCEGPCNGCELTV